MSEYQYYEFLAIDRPLTKKQTNEVRQFSTRATISSTHFVNEYHWGDFKGDPDLFIAKYFDVMVYTANWGTHRLLLGMPAEGIDLKAWKPFESDDGLDIRKSHDKIILDISSDIEPEYDEGGEGWMASLSPIRNEILSGDDRPLFLAWMATLHDEETDGPAPQVPNGLRRLTPAQSALVEFLRVDQDLLAAAQQMSAQISPQTDAMANWITSLPATEKDQLLVEAATGGNPNVGSILMRRYRAFAAAQPRNTHQPISLAKFFGTARKIRQEREIAEREEAARKRALREAEKTAERERHITQLIAREEKAWREVEDVLNLKRNALYDQAVTTLSDLREVAIRKGTLTAFVTRVTLLRETHRNKYTFSQRLDKANLPGQASA